VYALNKGAGVGSSINLNLLIVFIMLNIYFNTWNPTIINALNMLHHRISFVIFTLITLASGLVFSIVLVKTFSTSAVFWLSGMLLAQALVTIFALFYFIKVTQNNLDIKKIRMIMARENFMYILTFAFPLGVTTFFMWMQSQSYRMIIENTLGLEFLGLLGLGISISFGIAAAVESVIHQFYHPLFYREINTFDPVKRASAWNTMASLALPIYISLAIFVSCLSPYLINILAAEKFGRAAVYVAVGAWIEFSRVTNNILAGIAHAEMQTKYLIRSYLVGGLFVILGVYLGTKYHPERIIPVVLMLGGFVTTVIMYFEMKKLMEVKLEIRRIRQSIVLSIPFALALLFYNKPKTLHSSLAISLIFGLYFLIIHYILSKPLLKEKAQQ
jgi:O-antigen/teichoic acid export membrane protein